MAYFGQLEIDGLIYPVGSSLTGVCTTNAGTQTKIVNTGLLGAAFTELIDGITVNIQFTQGNTREFIYLIVGTTESLPVHGNAKCNTNAILSFTYGSVNNVAHWILNAGEKTSTTVMNTYDSTSTEPISGKGVAEAIAPLLPNGDSAAGRGVDTEIGATSTHNNVPTSRAVVEYVDNAFGSFGGMIYKGTIGINGTISEVPRTGYDAGWVYRVITPNTYAGQICEIGDLLMSISPAGQYQLNAVSAHWTVIQTNLRSVMQGPPIAVEGNVAIFGADSHTLADSGYTIQSSVPANAQFTDTRYESSGTESVVTGIEPGEGFVLANILNANLNIASGFRLTRADVIKGIRIQEVT